MNIKKSDKRGLARYIELQRIRVKSKLLHRLRPLPRPLANYLAAPGAGDADVIAVHQHDGDAIDVGGITECLDHDARKFSGLGVRLLRLLLEVDGEVDVAHRLLAIGHALADAAGEDVACGLCRGDGLEHLVEGEGAGQGALNYQRRRYAQKEYYRQDVAVHACHGSGGQAAAFGEDVAAGRQVLQGLAGAAVEQVQVNHAQAHAEDHHAEQHGRPRHQQLSREQGIIEEPGNADDGVAQQ